MDLPPDKTVNTRVKAADGGHEERLERWLCDEVISGHEEYLADPSQGIPAEDILARIKARRAAR